MSQGSIYRRELDGGHVRWDAVIDLGNGPNGKRRQRRRSFTTRREAQKALTAWQREIESGVIVDRSTRTVQDLMAYWLENHAQHHVSARTFAGYSDTIRLHIVPHLGSIEIQKLTPELLQGYFTQRLKAGAGPRTLRLCHLHLKQALTVAVKMGWVIRNVAGLVSPPRHVPKEMHAWSIEEARRFLEVADDSAHGPIWLVAITAGLRKGELLGLRWCDVNWERGTLSVRQNVGTVHGAIEIKPPKTAAGKRDVHVPAEVLEALKAHKARQNEQRLSLGKVWQDHDLLFPSAIGTPIHPDNLDRDFHALVKQAGVPRIRIHDVRHSYATLAIDMGAPIKAVSEALGHADIATTLRTYTHVLENQRVEVAEKVGAALFGGRKEAL
jgi:integrase